MQFDFFSRSTAAWLLAPILLLGGCAGLSRAPEPLINYKPEAFSASAYSRSFAAEPSHTCEAARRALLGQGYIVASAAADQVTARKYFQPNADHHVQFEFRVVCARDAGGSGNSIAFASGLQDQYSIRKVKESASLGVGGLGSLSLPVEGSMDSLVKVASETVTDSELYQRFFDLLADHLDSVIPPEPAEVPALSAPAAAGAPAPSMSSSEQPVAVPSASPPAPAPLTSAIPVVPAAIPAAAASSVPSAAPATPTAPAVPDTPAAAATPAAPAIPTAPASTASATVSVTPVPAASAAAL